MVTQRLYIPFIFGLLLLGASSLWSHVVVNEVMLLPKQGGVSLQWVELYNDSAFGKSLMGYRIETPSQSFTLPDSLILQPNEYYIICRQLFAGQSSRGFESVWGDSSNVWGDTPYESPLQKPLVLPITLTVSGGYVRLYTNTNQLESELAWNSSPPEGVSYERKTPDADIILPCEDILGATPFDINSVTPVGSDLALRKPVIRSSLGETTISFTIKNSGLAAVPSASLFLMQGSDTVTTIALSNLISGDSSIQQWSGQFTGLYVDLVASLSADDRSRNNAVAFTACGDLFPPFTLSEIAPSERDGIQAEWIELHKRLDGAVNLAGWQLRTEHGKAVIAPFNESVNDEYVIITEDKPAFQTTYPSVIAAILEVADWVTLINDADMVVLTDSNGIVADSFSYQNGNDVLVWAKTSPDLQSGWGASQPTTGTPGEPNQTVSPSDSSVTLTVDPQILGTDASGSNLMHISFTAPQGIAITLKIFDRTGHVVQTVYDGDKITEREVVWNGLDETGHQLPIGMYILYLQAGTAKVIKQPIVIAR